MAGLLRGDPRSTPVFFVTVTLLWFLTVSATESIQKVDHGVYSRITARISEQVPRQFCSETIDNLKALLASTSQRLNTLVDGHFRDVTIILPASWAGSECLHRQTQSQLVTNWVLTSSFRPDFLIDSPHPIFGGEQPWSKQFGPCGQSGLGVNIPFTLLADVKNITRNTEKRVLREWLRHQYGVFPERGFANDPMYPEWIPDYERGGQLVLNQGCNLTSLPPPGGDSRPDIRPRMDATTISRPGPQETGSQMVLCPSANYNPYAPTKQNLLCEGRSAMEIVSHHSDFLPIDDEWNKQEKEKNSEFNKSDRNLNQFSSPYSSSESTPQFHLVLPATRLRILLVLDISSRMSSTWPKTRDALFRFILLLPPGIELSIITFDNQARVNTEPTVVDESNKEGLFGRIPHRLSPDREGCIICGMELALPLITAVPGVAQGNANNSGVVVLISSSSFPVAPGQKMRKTRVDRVRKLVDTSVLPVYHVHFDGTQTRSQTKGFLPRDITRFGGTYTVNVHHKSPQFLAQTSLTLVSILNAMGVSSLQLCHEKRLTWSGQMLEGTFRVEDELSRNLWIVLTSTFKEDVESFQVTSPSGERFVFPKYDHSIVYFFLDGSNEPGIWSYSAQMHHTVQNDIVISIEVFAQPNTGSDSLTVAGSQNPPGIVVRTWHLDHPALPSANEHSNTSFIDNQPQVGPIWILAEVTQDGVPVQSAKAVANVMKPGVGGAKGVLELELIDDGLGYPDITAKDGIYSAYLTQFSSEPGTYEYTVTVSDHDGQARVSKPFGTGEQECCGSALPDYYTIPTPNFQRIVTGKSFHLERSAKFFVRNGSPQVKDLFSPNRISDLRVKQYKNSSLSVILQWTAPGDDLNHGRAARYEVRAYTHPGSASQFEEGIPVQAGNIPSPESHGVLQEAFVRIPWPNQVFYYAMLAIDDAGNRSPVSNLAAAFILEVTTTTHMEMSFRVVNGSDRRGVGEGGLSSRMAGSASSSWMDKETMVYLMAGGITAFVLLLTLVLLLAICKTNKKAKHSPSTSAITKGAITGPFIINGKQSTGVDKSTYDVWNASYAGRKSSHLDLPRQSMFPGDGAPLEDYGPMSWPYHTAIHALASHGVPPRGSEGTPTSLIMSSSSHHHQMSAHQVVGLPIHATNADLEMSSTSGMGDHSPTYNAWRNSTVVVGSTTGAQGGSGPSPDRSGATLPTGSDSGATHSTDCSHSTASGSTSDSDRNSDKNVYNVPSSTVSKDREFTLSLKDLDVSTKIPASLSVASINYERERKKRQESLV